MLCKGGGEHIPYIPYNGCRFSVYHNSELFSKILFWRLQYLPVNVKWRSASWRMVMSRALYISGCEGAAGIDDSSYWRRQCCVLFFVSLSCTISLFYYHWEQTTVLLALAFGTCFILHWLPKESATLKDAETRRPISEFLYWFPVTPPGALTTAAKRNGKKRILKREKYAGNPSKKEDIHTSRLPSYTPNEFSLII